MHLSCRIAVKLCSSRGDAPPLSATRQSGSPMTIINENISAASRAHFCHYRGTFLLGNFDPDFSERIDRIPAFTPLPVAKGKKKEESAQAGVSRGVMIASGDRRRWRTTFFRMPGSNWRGKNTVGLDDRPPAACFRDCELSPMQASADNARWSHSVSTTSSFAETTVASALKK